MGRANGCIGVFDSGVGGLSVWREIVAQLPQYETVYVADQAHVPYGSRSLEAVRGFSEGITRFLLEAGADVIVIACNTASAAALHTLRREFPTIPFVGMEPAVKPAAQKTHSGVVGVLATAVTFQGELFNSLLERYADDVTVLPCVCPGLVEAVEEGFLDTPATEQRLRRCLSPLLEAGIDELVLGCTHYPFLRPVLEHIVGDSIEVIDPAPAVARQVGRVLGQEELMEFDGSSGAPAQKRRHVFYTTDPGGRSKLSSVATLLLGQGTDGVSFHTANWKAGRLSIEHPVRREMDE